MVKLAAKPDVESAGSYQNWRAGVAAPIPAFPQRGREWGPLTPALSRKREREIHSCLRLLDKR